MPNGFPQAREGETRRWGWRLHAAIPLCPPSQKLKGLSMHQDFAGCGTAVPARVNELRVATLARMGATGWRTALNPVDPAVLDHCDAYGLVVMAEARGG